MAERPPLRVGPRPRGARHLARAPVARQGARRSCARARRALAVRNLQRGARRAAERPGQRGDDPRSPARRLPRGGHPALPPLGTWPTGRPGDPVAAARRPLMAYWRVRLPPGIRGRFDVYLNGVPQELGRDYRIESGELLFERELVNQKLGRWAWFLGFWGIGTYKRNDEVDVRYEVNGQPRVAHALEIVPPEAR